VGFDSGLGWPVWAPRRLASAIRWASFLGSVGRSPSWAGLSALPPMPRRRAWLSGTSRMLRYDGVGLARTARWVSVRRLPIQR